MSKFGDALDKIQKAGTSAAMIESPCTEPCDGLCGTPDFQTNRGNRRRAERYHCHIPASAAVFFESDVWIGNGAVINISDRGMLFKFQKTFLKEHHMSDKASVRARLNFSGIPGNEMVVEGAVAHSVVNNVTCFGIVFRTPAPEVLRLALHG